MTMTEVKESVLIVERKSALAWLRLNRPKVMNCLNRALLKEILEAVAAVENDPEIRVIGIIGAGTKAFCAGADLAERKTLTQGETLDYIALIQRTMRCLETSSKVVIAAINGSAWGGGFELALAADLRVMVTGAQLKLTEARLGIIPGAGGTQRLPRLIGVGKAKELIFTARGVDAAYGEKLGLINQTVAVSADEIASVASDGYIPQLETAV